MDIGFVGLGLMGQAFTRRLTRRGHRVHGYDIVADKLGAAQATGCAPPARPPKRPGRATWSTSA